MAEKKSKCECPAGAPLWMCTFADLMSLLLTFFVLLLSFSTIAEPEKFEQALTSLRGAFSIFEGSLEPISIQPNPPESDQRERLRRIARALREKLQVEGQEQEIEMRFDEGGLRIDLPSQVLFDSASAILRDDANPILGYVAELLAGQQGISVEVRGHTDDRPLSSSSLYRDNYDLSYGRAKSVTAALSRAGQIPMETFEIVALGPTDPIADNATEEGRSRNRRVELFIRADDPEASLEELQGRIEEGAPAPQQ